ncbi:vWA domain-containing protein [Massilia sp. NR 4-1]|uniref:vWA domain-containing protein n=1 Tax=Massilia sp. NR 4-1 TaxID=1678028 RepID=UPI00067ABD86|nr:vWA domain-containing protein [Massilia sp. NR 4-1]AKU20339.1 hypothetical protein ACZ75_01125 [Massilia sp. NR 4-1]
MHPLKKKYCCGQVAILAALLLPILIGAIGLAIDSGVGYLLRARLSSAVDAAGVAAARAVTQGATQADQIASAKQAARRFFDANIADGYLGSTLTWNDPAITFDHGAITIDTSAQASVKVSLMQVLGFNLLQVNAQAQTIRKDLDLAFVVDTTGSLSSVAAQVRTSAQSFLSMFNVDTDRISLIHFSVGGVVDVPFKADQSRGFDRTTMNTKIQNYSFGATTNYSEGLWQARDQLNRVILAANRSTLRVIVFFSDGAPNAFASYFTFKNTGNCALPGTIATGDTQTGNPTGLFRYDVQNQQLSGNCYQGNNILSYLTSTAIPPWYNAHDAADQEFPLVPNPSGMRSVTSTPSWTNINRAARNLAESMADKSRAEGIYVFTLGLGAAARATTGPDGETGEVLLKNMAHTVDSTKYSLPQYANQPVGEYCWAATAADLQPCFAQLASQILKISR